MKKTEFILSELFVGKRYWLDSAKDESGIYKGDGRWKLDKNVRTYIAEEDGLARLGGGLFYSYKSIKDANPTNRQI